MLCASVMLGLAAAAQSTWVDTLLAAGPPTPPEGPHQPPADQFEMSELIQPLLMALNHLNMEEFVMLVTAIWPLGMGLLALMRAISNNEKSGDEETGDGDHGHAIAQLSSRTESALTSQTEAVQKTIQGVETKVDALQTNHDARFADLHKDLAGIVWELSKLRADMARWQALAQLGARGASRSAASGGRRPPRAVRPWMNET